MRDMGYIPPEAEHEFNRERTAFLSSQMDLPREQWDPKFLDYIEQKRQELRREDEQPETEQRDEVGRYMKNMGLREEEIRGKKIIDLGTGDGGFVKECLKRGITDEIVGVDVDLEDDDRKGFEEHLIETDFTEDLPGEEYDLAVASASLPNPMDREDADGVKLIIDNILKSLKKGGELRISPVPKIHPESGLVGVEDQMRHWKEILDELESEGRQVELLPVDIKVSVDHDDVWLEQVAVIRKS